MFRTMFDRKIVHSAAGERFKKVYSAVVLNNGAVDLEEDGIEDTYAFIQSHKDSVDLNKILERYARGDVNALNRTSGVYGDFTEFPKTYAEALQAVIDAEKTFAELPLNVREKFGFDSNRFISSIGSSEWLSALGLDKPEPVKNVPEVIEGGDSIE